MSFLKTKDPLEILSIYPYRYDKNELIPFNKWKIDDRVFLNAILINKALVSRFNRMSKATFEVKYNEVIIKCVIYNRTWITKLNPGSKINIVGKYNGQNQVTVSNYNTNDLESELGLHPIYRLTNKITINSYRKFVKKIYQFYFNDINDFLPTWIKNKYKLLDYKIALRYIHFPKSEKEISLGIRTLKYHEFIRFHLINILQKTEIACRKIPKQFDHNKVFTVANSLNFNLTNDQIKTTNEILNDLASNKIMTRLLQGDVGSGKTLVAALSMYATVLSGYQAAFMAPTEILAIQQTNYLKQLFKRFDIKVVSLYSALKNYKKDVVLENISNGDAQIVVGTHSLIQDNIKFKNLGMVVIDEQQRFGVKQRATLNQKGLNVDQLLMTATPIPRTMAAALFSDMDISTIEELPLGRKKIKTKLIADNSMKSIIDFIVKKINEKDQVYVVCPAIEDSMELDMANVLSVYKNLDKALNQRAHLNIEIGLLHGKLDSEKKDHVMSAFKQGKIKILVTTTVIEVGINVKEANIMVIYDADRFGLSQLHQLRGRVGRGSRQGYCFLLTASKDEETIARLKVIEENLDGFKISEQDLKIRGAGDLIGTRQSGFDNFVLGDIYKDQVMLKYALEDAKEIVANSTDNENSAIIRNVRNLIKKKTDLLER